MRWLKSQLAFIANKIIDDIKLTPDEKVLLNSILPSYTIYNKEYVVSKIKESMFNENRITFYKFDTSIFNNTNYILSRIVGRKALIEYKNRYMTLVKDISLIATNYTDSNTCTGSTPLKNLLLQPFTVIKSALYTIYPDDTIPIQTASDIDELDLLTEFVTDKEGVYNEFVIREGDYFIIAVYDKTPKFYTLLDDSVKEISIDDVVNFL